MDHMAGTTEHEAGAISHQAGAIDQEAGATNRQAGATDQQAGAIRRQAGAISRQTGVTNQLGICVDEVQQDSPLQRGSCQRCFSGTRPVTRLTDESTFRKEDWQHDELGEGDVFGRYHARGAVQYTPLYDGDLNPTIS